MFSFFIHTLRLREVAFLKRVTSFIFVNFITGGFESTDVIQNFDTFFDSWSISFVIFQISNMPNQIISLLSASVDFNFEVACFGKNTSLIKCRGYWRVSRDHGTLPRKKTCERFLVLIVYLVSQMDFHYNFCHSRTCIGKVIKLSYPSQCNIFPKTVRKFASPYYY